MSTLILLNSNWLIFAKKKLSAPFVPGKFLFIDQFPRNSTGKIIKKELRAMVIKSETEQKIPDN